MRFVVAMSLALVASCIASSSSLAAVGHYRVETRGVRVYFEDREHAYGWSSGQVVQALASDSALQAEILVQLGEMKALGMNTIAFELRSVGDVRDNQPPPDCRLSDSLGVHWPDPLPNEITGLRTLLNLLRVQGMRLDLHLTNTHHEAPDALQERWLGPLLMAVKDDPVLDYVTFDGDVSLHPDGKCGGQSEAALWMGPNFPTAHFVEHAIRYGMQLGIPARQLTAEAIVPFPWSPWHPAPMLKWIFDRIGVPDAERTYALSHYERGPTPHKTLDDALAEAYREIGATPGDRNGPRVLLSEFGYSKDMVGWSTSDAVESTGVLMSRYGLDGGNFWLWAVMNDPDEYQWEAVKRRGRAFVYNPVAHELADLYGFHLEPVPAASFESDWREGWKISGKGSVRQVPFGRAGQLPWRGRTALRLSGRPAVTITSLRIPVTPTTIYTVAGDYSTSRTGSFVQIVYYTCDRGAPTSNQRTVLRLSRTHRYETFIVRFMPAADACSVRIRITASRGPLLVDNLR